MGEELPAEPHVAVPERLRTHAGGAERDRRLGVVVAPVLGEQAAGSLELLEERRARERRQEADGRAIQAQTSRLHERTLEGGLVVAVESEDDARLDRDPVRVDPRDSLGVGLDDVEGLVGQLQAVRTEGLEAKEEADASGARRGREQALVARAGQGDHRGPPPVRALEGPEKAKRVSAVHEELVVPEREQRRAEAPDLGDHLLHGPEAQRGGVDLAQVAVAAAMRAPAGRDDGVGEQATADDQVAAGPRQALQRGRLVGAILRRESAASGVGEQLRPGGLRLADDQGVGVGARLVRPAGSGARPSSTTVRPLARKASARP